MKKVALLLALMLTTLTTIAQNTYTVDQMHSSINFSVKHMGIAFIEGRFTDFSGEFIGDIQEIEKGNFNFSIQTNSINTDIEPRDNHLKGADFFDAEKYQTISFASTSIEKKDDNIFLVKGKLTIKNTTKLVEFKLNYGGSFSDEQNNTQTLGFRALTTINRVYFGIDYDPSALAIAKEIDIIVNIEVKK